MHKTITDWARTSPLREVKMLHFKAPIKGTRGRYLRSGPYETNKVRSAHSEKNLKELTHSTLYKTMILKTYAKTQL